MLETPETFQVGLTAWLRGPEVAFVIRQGDLRAFDRVAAVCCDFWNGANSLIIPVRADGRVQPMFEDLLDVHSVETCYVAPDVPEAAQSRLQSRFGTRVRHWVPLYDSFDERELHPLLLQPSYQRDAEPVELRVPTFSDRRLQRIALACWGRMHEEARSDYEASFELTSVGGVRAHGALLDGQLNGLAPIEQSIRLIDAYGVNPSFARVLAVFERGSFDELIQFWNLRSRIRGLRGRPLIVGVAREALTDPQNLAALARWIESDPYFDVEPDLGIWTMPTVRDEAAAALEAVGFVFDDGSRVRRRFMGTTARDRPLSFGFFAPHLGGPLKRGALAHQQITLTRSVSTFQLTRPDDFIARTGHHIRVGFEGLPLGLPVSERSATAVMQNAYRSPEGVTIVTDAHIGQGYLRVELPDPWVELEGWAAAAGWSAEPSQAGRYAQALLDRLNTLDRLDVLADDAALAVLSALAPPSRKKLAQRLVKQAMKEAGTSLDERVLADHLADQALFLELHARTLTEIGSLSALTKPQVLGALSQLIDAGFVVRGVAADCPQCRYREILRLNEQDERVACRACGKRFLLPVTAPGGKQERAPVYRLDGLMGRAMDQDLLPVLLAVRALAAIGLSNPVRSIWPGLEFSRADSKMEIDAVLSDGETVWVCECKSQADGLPDAQLDGLLAFATASSARPAIASLSGTFPAPQASRVQQARGLVLDRDALVARD